MASVWGESAPTQVTISAWLRGKSLPRVDYLEMLSSTLSVRPAWLAFDDGPMTAKPAIDPATEAAFDEAARKHQATQVAGKRGKRAG